MKQRFYVELSPYRQCRDCQRHSENLSAIRLGMPRNLHAGGTVLGEFSMADDYIVDECGAFARDRPPSTTLT